MAEINRTVHENIIPIGSIISVMRIGVWNMDNVYHSRIVVVPSHMYLIVVGRRRINNVNIIGLAIMYKLIYGFRIGT